MFEKSNNTTLCIIFLIIALLFIFFVCALGKNIFNCISSCDDKECGNDGCGGSCGECDPGEICINGQCRHKTRCIPLCGNNICGDDGCDGSCGDCETGYSCEGGQCVEDCIPSCGGDEPCGDDGCGGSCGECKIGEICDGGQCKDRFQCLPLCEGRKCGVDGCGNSCGTCDSGYSCERGQCVCDPSCGDNECGSDGCGGSCGTCDSGYSCESGQCVCDPSCGDNECGSDGCGRSCGTCDSGYSCESGQCVCDPSCGDNECGGDGCGGSCGTCDSGYSCESGQCVCDPSCGDNECGGDGCGGSCGTCDSGYSCESGQCVCDPSCGDNECGSDGCGGSCGSCDPREVCINGQCVGSDITVPTVTVEDSHVTYIIGTDNTFEIVWDVDYELEKGSPDDFTYSVTISDPTSSDSYYFDDISKTNPQVQDSTGEFSGVLSGSDGTYTFDITPMLPSGTYNALVEMFTIDMSHLVSSDTGDSIATVIDPVTGVKTDRSTYAFNNFIACTWTKPSDTADYTYTISILDKDGNTVDYSTCSGVGDKGGVGTPFQYSPSKFTPSTGTDCFNGSQPYFGVQLESGGTYSIKVVSCDEGGICDDGVTSDNTFSIVECVTSDDCSVSNSETNLLGTDPYARMIYELQCSYADDVEECLNAYYSSAYHPFDGREIPSVCLSLSDGSEKVCSRAICPPMSVPYTDDGGNTYAGCTAPYNDQYPNNPANSSFQSGGYFSYKGADSSVTSTAAGYSAPPGNDTNQFSYGYPFIAIIEGGDDPNAPQEGQGTTPLMTNQYQIDLSSTSQIVAVPGMTGYDDDDNDGNPSIFIMPIPIQNFHPFMVWNTFYIKDDNGDPAGGAQEMEYGDSGGGTCKGYGFNLYHVGSSTYLDNNTDKCKSSSGDSGKLCTARMDVMTYIDYYTDNEQKITCNRQPDASNDTRNSCFTSNIWLDKTDAEFPYHKDVDISDTNPSYTTGVCNDINTDYSISSNNWNAPVKGYNYNQGLIYFGQDTLETGKLWHRDEGKGNGGSSTENRISHMRRWVIDQNNNYFWSSGLGAGMSYTGTDGKSAVYQALAAQWPNGPPYIDPSQRPLDIRFSAPIQYGIAPMSQAAFHLEVYSWDSDYSTFEGLGFISNDNGDPADGVLNGVVPLKWAISCSNIYDDDTCEQYYGKDITNMNTTDAYGDKRYMSWASANTSRAVFSLDITPANNPAAGTSSGTIKFLPSGYINLHLDDNGADYWLCIDNVMKKLVWINMANGSRTYENDFTPLMLAMSWE